MANPEHVAILKQGVEVWNRWRAENPDVIPDLSELYMLNQDLAYIDFSNVNLSNSCFSGTVFFGAKFTDALLINTILSRADLCEVNLSVAIVKDINLGGAKLSGANLKGMNLQNINLSHADLGMDEELGLGGADLSESNLSGANLTEANLSYTFLWYTNLKGARLWGAKLWGTELMNSSLNKADLRTCTLIETNLEHADISECQVYGVAIWNAKVRSLKQTDLIINRPHEAEIRVDDLEVAQFVYLLLNNQKLRNVIDTLTTKAVLILGRFTDERKAVLDAIREELRKQGYLPILFDFEKPRKRNLTETIMTLASLARFVIADLSAPNSIGHELKSIAPTYLSVPIQGIFCATEGHETPYPLYEDLQWHPHVLPIYEYQTLEGLMERLNEDVIRPAEAMFESIQERLRRKS